MWRKSYVEIGVTYFSDSMAWQVSVAGENANGDWELRRDEQSLDLNVILAVVRSELTFAKLRTVGGSTS